MNFNADRNIARNWKRVNFLWFKWPETGNASDNHAIKMFYIKFEGNNLKVTIESSKTDQMLIPDI
jgi:hypothetical protein